MEEIRADLIRHIAEERVRWSGDNRDRQSVNRKRQVDSGDFTSQPRRHCERARFDLASDLSGWGRLLAGRYEIQPRHCTGTCQCKISFRLTTRSPVSEQSTSMSKALATPLVEHGEGAKPASTDQAVVNELDCPGLIRRHRPLAHYAQMAQTFAPAASAQRHLEAWGAS